MDSFLCPAMRIPKDILDLMPFCPFVGFGFLVPDKQNVGYNIIEEIKVHDGNETGIEEDKT